VVTAFGPAAAFAADDPAVAAPPSIFGSATLQSQATPQLPAPAPVEPVPASTSTIGGGRPVDIGRLAAMRGGQDTNESSTSVDGSVHDNTADHVASGSNSITGGAFASASGLNTVIQNSGSNVLIQNGMSIQVIFANPGR
jgi:hypothetical protein